MHTSFNFMHLTEITLIFNSSAELGTLTSIALRNRLKDSSLMCKYNCIHEVCC